MKFDRKAYQKQYNKQYYFKNIERIKQYRRDNIEHIKKYMKQYHADNEEHDKQYRIDNKRYKNEYNKLWYQANKEYRKEYIKQYQKQYRKDKRRTNLKFNLNSKMSTTISYSLRNNKGGQHWEDLVGYALSDLIKHLKKTIPNGYDWQDFLDGRLHIDHIVPKSVFNYTKANQFDFERCWALDNLQLLPAKTNLEKSNKLYKSFQPALAI